MTLVLVSGASAESEVEVNSRKRVISFYETYTSPELPVDEKDYNTPELQQQLAKLKVLC